MLLTVAILLAGTAGAGTSQKPAATGSLAGCVLETGGLRLPGVDVVAKAEGIRRTAQTDVNGCYELKGLAAGEYRVTMLLLGFDNVTRERVRSATGSVTRLDVTMRLSPICECVRIERTLRDHWHRAAAVLRVRVLGPDSGRAQPAGAYRQAATVIEALKPPPGAAAPTVSLLQNQTSGAPEPYGAGEELVVFLTAAEKGQFKIVNDEPGLAIGSGYPAMAFHLREGRIQDGPPEFRQYVGMPIARFLQDLRALGRRAGR